MFTMLYSIENKLDGQTVSAWKEKNCLLFTLPYTPPYAAFPHIRRFQKESRFRPFCQEGAPSRHQQCCIDLSGWAGHSEEGYLELFFQFLHDYEGFYRFSYLFILTGVGDQEAKKLYRLVSSYIPQGQLVAVSSMCLSALTRRYQLAYPGLALGLARDAAQLLLKEPGLSLAQMDTLMEDLIKRGQSVTTGRKLSEKTLGKHPQILRQSALYHRRPEDSENWLGKILKEVHTNG